MFRHVALVTSSGEGHTLPMAAVASLMARCSETVRITLLYPANSPAPSLPKSPRITAQSFECGYEGGMKAMWKMRDEMRTACESALRLSVWETPCMFLFDMFATWVMDMAKDLGKSHALLWTAPLHFLYTLLNDKCTEVPDIGTLRAVDFTDHGDAYSILRPHFDRLRDCRVVVANDSQLLYGHSAPGDVPLLQQSIEALLNGLVYPAGLWAVGDVRIADMSDPTIAWLDEQEDRSVVYVALGTWCPIPAYDVVELARGLESSGVNFLWARRGKSAVPPFIPHAPREYMLPQPSEETAEDGLPLGFRENVKDRAMIAAWVNQPAVLRHPAIKAFITHCGWNSLTEALCLAGVPLIGLPLMADQNLNAILMEKLGVGERLWLPDHPRLLSREKVRANLNDAQKFVQKARELQSLLKQSWDHDGCGSHQMKKFLQREVADMI